MTHNTRFFLFLLFAFCLASCVKEGFASSSDARSSFYEQKEQAFRDFATILSSAVYNEPALRNFLKQEALKRIDNDYDVFYPWSCNNNVDRDRSFRDVLLSYDYDEKLEGIEMALPLLTIYVPDWSWLDPHCFSINNWDTDDAEVAVSYRTNKADKPLYGNGKLLGTIPQGNFPDHPVLIVKDNERIRKNNPGTRSDGDEYSFIDPAYNGLRPVLQTKAGYTEVEYNFDTTPATTKTYRMFVTPKAIDAYNQANNATGMTQRDHLYYDMTSAVDSGVVNSHYVERIFKYKLRPACSAFYDDTTTNGNDSELYYEASPGQELTESQVKAMTWDEGELELVFYVRAGDYTIEKHTSVSMGDAFTPSKVFYKYYKNIFGTVTWRSYYTYSQHLVSKWITTEHNLFNWNLKYLPYIYTILVEEKDSGTTITRTLSSSYTYATNFSTSLSGGDDMKIGYNTGGSSTTSHSSTYSESYIQSNDSLGSFMVSFSDPIITSMTSSGSYAFIYLYSTGDIDVLMMPINIY